jgi:hypothetical protein
MKEIVAAPIGLIINHYSIAIKEMEVDEVEPRSHHRARYIDVAFCVIDEESGDEFYSLANTYSLN